ncbi:uncharacterized protein MONOS_5929 [Monocercomonoides exilis]|uniref:uncharacterized protein n=1 Tax=Monocercomonoides exilis TaxID=2049356 RepID=UPI00355972D6|nr:hypothetical protein MONOS_5929 [Monocercomonoides exilis]|eukprot:MONOS_5929.1-p1 / transcript=MONOS_5929.1 / gene=MONOS_5929 / organism=Monocercomonoides_exilis_PA203 / gene_product=unspecified product / transcript_product=unspecified product / location=Mono_scaffold00179:14869-16548(+) / protein_length=522 / sequence_SO=supercontig / SO=protein_coding / is_pseudo=false
MNTLAERAERILKLKEAFINDTRQALKHITEMMTFRNDSDRIASFRLTAQTFTRMHKQLLEIDKFLTEQESSFSSLITCGNNLQILKQQFINCVDSLVQRNKLSNSPISDKLQKLIGYSQEFKEKAPMQFPALLNEQQISIFEKEPPLNNSSSLHLSTKSPVQHRTTLAFPSQYAPLFSPRLSTTPTLQHHLGCPAFFPPDPKGRRCRTPPPILEQLEAVYPTPQISTSISGPLATSLKTSSLLQSSLTMNRLMEKSQKSPSSFAFTRFSTAFQPRSPYLQSPMFRPSLFHNSSYLDSTARFGTSPFIHATTSTTPISFPKSSYSSSLLTLPLSTEARSLTRPYAFRSQAISGPFKTVPQPSVSYRTGSSTTPNLPLHTSLPSSSTQTPAKQFSAPSFDHPISTPTSSTSCGEASLSALPSTSSSAESPSNPLFNSIQHIDIAGSLVSTPVRSAMGSGSEDGASNLSVNDATQSPMKTPKTAHSLYLARLEKQLRRSKSAPRESTEIVDSSIKLMFGKPWV